MGSPLTEYHPIRYEQDLRHLIDDIILAYQNTAEDEKAKLGGLLLARSFMDYMGAQLSEQPAYLPVGLSIDDWLQYKEELFSAYIAYESNGENIFHLQPDLYESFRHTDVSKVPIDGLKVPNDSFYLYFGGSKDFPISDGQYIDGAYIDADEDNLVIFVFLTTTRRHTIQRYDELEAMNSDDHLYYLLNGNEEGKSVGASVENTFREAGVENYNRARFRLWEPHLKEITNIIVNALRFMASDNNDVSMYWIKR